MTRRTRQPSDTPVAAPKGAHRAALVRYVEQLAQRHQRWNVFSDFVEMSAISISNAVDLVQRDERELRYAEIVKRYDADEMKLFPEMFGELVLALEDGFDDVLGRVFHDLELHNHFQGQFFTPFELCRAMASVTLGDRAPLDAAIAERGFITVLEPACGSGAMVVALAEQLKAIDINYQHALHATLVDVDSRCVHMAYLQMSLLHVPAVIIAGNSLTNETRARWYTPAHILGGWRWKLLRAAATETEPSAEPSKTGEQLSLPENVA